MKRWLAVLLLSIAHSVIATDIEVWSGLDNTTIKEIETRFEQQTDHTMSIREFYIDNIRSEMLVASQSNGEVPDVLYLPSDLLGLHQFLNLSPIPEDWLMLERFEPKAKSLIHVDGHYFGVPLAIGNHLVLYVNKDQTKQLTPTWEELFQQVERGPSSIAMQYPNMYFFMSFTSLFSRDDMQVATDVEVSPLASTLRFYQRLIDSGLMVDGCDQECARAQFLRGEVNYLIDGDWALGELKQSMVDDLVISALPSYQGKPMRSLSGGKVLIFTKQAMQDPIKREALQALANMVQQSEFIDSVIIGQNLISANAKLNELSFYSYSTFYTQLYTQLAPALIMPSSVTMAIFWEAVSQGIKRYQLGMPAEESATFILEFVRANLAKINGIPEEDGR